MCKKIFRGFVSYSTYILSLLFSLILVALTLGECAHINLIRYTSEPVFSFVFPFKKMVFALGLGAFFVMMSWIVTKVANRIKKNSDRLFFLVLLLVEIPVFCFCLWWISINQVPPKWDSAELVTMARNIATGQNIKENLWYFNSYSHLRGIVLIMAIVYYIFPDGGLTIIYLINSILVLLTIHFIGRIVYNITANKTATIMTVVMLDTFLPLSFYVLFVYGTVPSLFFVVMGFYFTLLFCNSMSWKTLIGMCISFLVAAFFYSGAMIAVLATIIYLLFVNNNAAKLKTWIAILGLLIVLFFVGKISSSLFSVVVAQTSDNAQPISLYLLGGLASDDGLCGAGSFDGHIESYYNELVAQGGEYESVIWSDVKKVFLDYFNGNRSLFYFVEKWKCEWTNSMFDSTRVTQTTNVEMYGIGKEYIDFLRGAFFINVHFYLDIFQFLIYVLAFFGCIKAFLWRQKEFVLFGMYFVGGFLFQTLFEQAARYCMIYFLVLIPIAACVIDNIRKALLENEGFSSNTSVLQRR